MISVIRYQPNCHFICHSHHSTIRFNWVDSPISRIWNLLHSQNSCLQVFPKQPLVIIILFRWGTKYNFVVMFGIGMSFAFGFPPWSSTRARASKPCHLHLNESNTSENWPHLWNLKLSLNIIANISQHTTTIVIKTKPHCFIPSLFIFDKFEQPIIHRGWGAKKSLCYFPLALATVILYH